MEGFTKKTLKVSRGYTYTYYVSTNKVDDSLPALFFCHGWVSFYSASTASIH